MSPTSLAEFDSGEIPAPPGEHTRNLAPYGFLPPAFRRPAAIRPCRVCGHVTCLCEPWDEAGLEILVPISGGSGGNVYPRPARPRRGRGRRRHPSLLVRAWRQVVGAW